MDKIELHLGDCLDVLRLTPANSIDAVITDPPYGLSFMGKKWDYDVPSVELWREVFKVLKPGGHVLSFGGTRTYHRMVVNMEDAGFEIRDQVMWLYGSGFPKSHDISKGIDKQAGAEREVIKKSPNWRPAKTKGGAGFDKDVGQGETEINITAPATPEAKQWQGWGTALKPANEPICLARKPLEKGLTVAENVLKWGTGAINVDGCRIGTEVRTYSGGNKLMENRPWTEQQAEGNREKPKFTATGRWPANLLLDETAAEMLDAQSGELGKSAGGNSTNIGGFVTANSDKKKIGKPCGFGDSGGASRFFYVAKASKRERNSGLEGMPKREPVGSKRSLPAEGRQSALWEPMENFHPTVKPIKLMEYLVTLITPPNGTVLDPFMGSGSTGIACKNLGFNFIGIERDKEYYEIADKRINQKNEY